MLQTLYDTIATYRARRFIDASCHRDKLYQLPPGLYDFWAATAGKEFPGIPRDALFFARAAHALMEFFDAVSVSDKPCALPSKAADSVWHAWLRHSPYKLERFCSDHFGRRIPHLEAHAMPVPMDVALAACLVEARRLHGMPAGGLGLPPLFTTDRQLRMPHGYAYRSVGSRIMRAPMDGRGREWAYGLVVQSHLDHEALAAAGLLREWEAEQARREAQLARSSSDGGGGELCLDSGDGGDSSGCGSSCGGCGGD